MCLRWVCMAVLYASMTVRGLNLLLVRMTWAEGTNPRGEEETPNE